MENYIPKIRFKGAYDENGKWVEFTHPWEQRKLGELYSPLTERNTDLLPYNRTLSVATMTYKTDGNGAADSSLANYKRLRIGDIAFEGHTSKEFRYGRFVLNDAGDGIMSPRFSALRPLTQMPTTFWKYYIHYEPIMRKVLVNSTKAGTMMNELVVAEFLKSSLYVPSKAEQIAIGQYFTTIDHLITLHQRKYDLYQQAKQSMMEKLYSFNSDWEEKALGEILIRNPKSNIGVHEAQQMKCGDIPYFTSGEKIFYINDFLVKGENIFVNDGGVADIKYYNGKANYSDHILSLKNIDNSICLQFVYQSLLSKINIINDKLFHGLGLKNLSKKDFMNFTISIPSIEEQIKIANILSKYDELIAISKNQLDSLKTLKRGLLQQMFI